MTSVILVNPNGPEQVTVSDVWTFNILVYNQGWHPLTGTVDAAWQAIQGGPAPTGKTPVAGWNIEDLAQTIAFKSLYVPFVTLVLNPDQLISGTITRDANGAATSAPVTWPDGTPGTYTADVVSTAFPGSVDAYHVTYGSPTIRTYTQPTVTRSSNGAVTTRPALVVS